MNCFPSYFFIRFSNDFCVDKNCDSHVINKEIITKSFSVNDRVDNGPLTPDFFLITLDHASYIQKGQSKTQKMHMVEHL
jgi:hypothetical protein